MNKTSAEIRDNNFIASGINHSNKMSQKMSLECTLWHLILFCFLESSCLIWFGSSSENMQLQADWLCVSVQFFISSSMRI